MTDRTQDPYDDGSVPRDADFQPDSDDVTQLLPGGGRLDEGEENPRLDEDDIRPSGGAGLP